jgi:endogenous inhibitor of DNA gyrase (YacG/DUF329 family)
MKKKIEHPCGFCGAEVKQTPGKKLKKFCNDSCRQKDFQRARKDAYAAMNGNATTEVKEKVVKPAKKTSMPEPGNAPPVDRAANLRRIKGKKTGGINGLFN